MLVLGFDVDNRIVITMPDGRDIVLTRQIANRIGIEAPRDVAVLRDRAKQRQAPAAPAAVQTTHREQA